MSSCVNQHKDNEVHKKDNAPTIFVYYYNKFPSEIADYAVNKLKEYYPQNKVIVKGITDIPQEAIYKSSKTGNRRLWAPTLLEHQEKMHKKKQCIVLAFTIEDIASDVNHNGKLDKDWGVFGLGSKYRHSCICSLYRMKTKNDKKESFQKLVFHELGHCFGLPHCTNDETCYVSDAEKKYHLPRLKGFCTNCTKTLNKLGWSIPSSKK